MPHAVDRDQLIDALVVDQHLDARRVPVARAAGQLVEVGSELGGRLAEARRVDRQVLRGRLGVALELSGRLLPGRLQALGLADAGVRPIAVGQRHAYLVAAVVGDQLADARWGITARAGLVVGRLELGDGLVVAVGLHRRDALGRFLGRAAEQAAFLLADGLDLLAPALVGGGARRAGTESEGGKDTDRCRSRK